MSAPATRPPQETPDEPTPNPGPSLGRILIYGAPFALFAALGVVLALQVTTQNAAVPPTPACTITGEMDLPLLLKDGLLETAALQRTGGPVVVNFWASWCAPCHAEHPFLVELAESGAATMIGVAYKNEPKDAKAFLAQNGNPFSAIAVDQRGLTAVSWGVRLLPQTFVLSAKGELVYCHSGQILPGQLETAILPAIERARTY